jgi:phosphoglycolate phosphatase
LRAVIFDLDGTLINSAIYFKEMRSRIIEYLQSVGVKQGLLNDRMLNFEITSIAVEQLRQKGFSEEQTEQVLEEVSHIMNQFELDSLKDATLVEGAPETLKALKVEGLKLGLMTRGCREYAEKVLARFELREFFDAVLARDEVENPKPNPKHAFRLLRLLGVSADETLSVGDHWLDAECAEKAGLKFVLVKRHGQITEALEKFSFHAVDSIRDIVKFVQTS